MSKLSRIKFKNTIFLEIGKEKGRGLMTKYILMVKTLIFKEKCFSQ
jgi:hypothetical protein